MLAAPHPSRFLAPRIVGVLLALGLVACGGPSPGDADPPTATDESRSTTPSPHDPPAGAGAMAPRLSAASGSGVWASWLEPVEGGTGSGEAPAHRLRVARFDGEAWSAPETVATAGPEHPFFANWADTPSVVEGIGGELLAHWLAKTGESTYAYAVFLARSTDGGTTWRELGTLHDDDTPTEHGFVSLLPDPGGGFRAFWLDGRAMVEGGPMALRTARVDGGVVGESEVLDDRVCECCQTSAALTGAGSLVVYRDRSLEEVRDVYAVRSGTGDENDDGPGEGGRDGDGGGGGDWSAPAPVHPDGWVIPGCPVNGPAVAAHGERVVVAWFTAADGAPRVRAATSTDGGATFGRPIDLDGTAAGEGDREDVEDEPVASSEPTTSPGGGPGSAGRPGEREVAGRRGAPRSAASPAGPNAGKAGVEGSPAEGRSGDGPGAAGGGRAPADPPPLGRVDVELLADGTAVISWLAGDGTVRLRRLSAEGTAGPAVAVAATSTARASGFPRIQPVGDGRRLGVAWVEPEAEAGSRLRFATLPLASLPLITDGPAPGNAGPPRPEPSR